MWKTKEFKTEEAKDKFVKYLNNRYQIEEIFINNGFGIEYRPLKIIKFK
jgi:hypothetical protein